MNLGDLEKAAFVALNPQKLFSAYSKKKKRKKKPCTYYSQFIIFILFKPGLPLLFSSKQTIKKAQKYVSVGYGTESSAGPRSGGVFPSHSQEGKYYYYYSLYY